MPVFTPYSARNCAVRIGASTPVYVKRWTVTPSAELIREANSESGCYKNVIVAERELQVQIECDDDGATSLFDAGLKAGLSVAMKLYLNTAAGPYWSLTFVCEQIPMTADVRHPMGVRISGYANGEFIYPTGTAGSTS